MYMNKYPMKYLLLLGLFCSSLFLVSCNSSKHLSRTSDRTAELSRQLGFKVTRKDDLRLYTAAAEWLGTPYRYGGMARKGVDCSGLINQIYKQVYHKSLERSSSNMATKNCRKIMKNDLKSGDLVFFNTSQKRRKGINHVGLFLKNGYFIHASTSKGVIISNLKEEYYRKCWKQGGRVK